MSRRSGRLLTGLAVAAAATGAGAAELPAALRAAGLERVEMLPGDPPLARGRLPGSGALEVVLFAGCGAGAAASREAALAAAADLARTPRRHGFELVVCGAPAAPRRAARAWLASRPPVDRGRLLAVLHLEPGEGGPGVARLRRAEGTGGRLPPAWLAHAALGGAGAAGVELALGAERWRLLAQLAGRYARPPGATGAEPFLAAGIPALALAGTSRADPAAGGWATVVAAIVRRLDGLGGRPRPDDVYLGLGGRIWSRRDLYWAGLAVWVTQLLGGLPGAWRGAGGAERRRRGRRYLPGFVFRMLFLVAILAAPVATLLLLAPAGLLTLAPVRRPAAVLGLRLLALVPVALFALYLALAAALPVAPAPLALVLAGLALALSRIGSPPPPPARPAS